MGLYSQLMTRTQNDHIPLVLSRISAAWLGGGAVGLIITDEKRLSASGDVEPGSKASGINVRHRPCGHCADDSPSHKVPFHGDMGCLLHCRINKIHTPKPRQLSINPRRKGSILT
jgi:hypothetical protein